MSDSLPEHTPTVANRLVLIEWEDSYGVSPGWERLSKCEPFISTCKSVGWLIHDDDKVKVVVPHLSAGRTKDDVDGCGDMGIPASAVRRIVDLQEVHTIK